MYTNVVKIIESLIINNASLTVFLGCILEQIIVPIPASLIVLSSTFLILKGTSFSPAALGVLTIKIIIPASLGITLGSLFYYGLAYKMGMPFIERTSKYLGVSVEDVEDVGKKVDESSYDELFIFLARCFPVIPSIAVNLFCGLIKYDLKKYVVVTFLGSAVQIVGWSLLAWFFGNIFHLLEDKITSIGNIITGLLILIIIYFVIKKKQEMNRKNRQ